jgi:hypothetical protein
LYCELHPLSFTQLKLWTKHQDLGMRLVPFSHDSFVQNTPVTHFLESRFEELRLLLALLGSVFDFILQTLAVF